MIDRKHIPLSDMPTLYSQISNISILRRSWHLARHYSRNHFMVDPYQYADFAYKLDERLRYLSQSLTLGTYHPRPPLKIDISKSTLSVRPGTVLEIEDMVVLFAITLLIARQLDKQLPDSVYSWRVKEKARGEEIFRDLELLHLPFLKAETISKQIDIAEPWYGQWPDFIEKMEYVYEKEGYTFLVVSDIAAYFENIDLSLLRDILISHLPKQMRIINFLVSLLEYWAWPTVHGTTSPRGIPQGNAVSSFLGNVYLLPLDSAFINFKKNHDAKYFRYMDDVKVFAKDRATARESLFLMNDKLRTLCLNMQGAKTRILEGGETREELFDNRLQKVNHVISSIQKLPTISTSQRQTFQTALRTHVVSVAGRKGIIRDKEFRLFRRLLTGYTLIRHPGMMRIVLNQIERNPDARLLQSSTRYFQHLSGSQKMAAKKIAALLSRERELFPYQQASLIIALKFLLILDSNTWSQVWRLSRLRGLHWYVRQQAALLLGLKSLGKPGLTTVQDAFQKEDNVEVKMAWIQCLMQLPREQLEDLSRALTLSVHAKLHRVGRFMDGLLFDKTLGEAYLKSIFDDNREDILLQRFFVVELLSKCKHLDVQSGLLENLIRIKSKICRPLLKARTQEIIGRIKVDIGGQQLGFSYQK